jgi:hypothetical protein
VIEIFWQILPEDELDWAVRGKIADGPIMGGVDSFAVGPD